MSRNFLITILIITYNIKRKIHMKVLKNTIAELFYKMLNPHKCAQNTITETQV